MVAACREVVGLQPPLKRRVLTVGVGDLSKEKPVDDLKWSQVNIGFCNLSDDLHRSPISPFSPKPCLLENRKEERGPLVEEAHHLLFWRHSATGDEVDFNPVLPCFTTVETSYPHANTVPASRAYGAV